MVTWPNTSVNVCFSSILRVGVWQTNHKLRETRSELPSQRNHKRRKTTYERPSQRSHKFRQIMNNLPKHYYSSNKLTTWTRTHISNRRFNQVLLLLSVPAALAFQKRNLQLQLRKLAYQLPFPTNSSNSSNRSNRTNRSNSSNSSNRSSNNSTFRDTY